MSRGKFSKAIPTKARVTFSENWPTNTTPGINNCSNTETTPSTTAVDTADDYRLTDIITLILSKKPLVKITEKDATLKEVRDIVIRNDEERLKDISPYIYSYWRDISVKHGCLGREERIAISRAIKDAALEEIHSTRSGSFAIRYAFSGPKYLVALYPSRHTGKD